MDHGHSQWSESSRNRNSIVVTAPSSPESSPGWPRNDTRRSLQSSRNLLDSRTSHDPSFHPMNNLEVPDTLRSKSHFELLLEAADLPEPGPAHFVARQKLWRVPRPHASTVRPQHAVFERFLEKRRGKLDSDEAWHAGLEHLWKGITSGAKLKQNMPLSYLIPILQAGWVQDGTWPKGSVVPTSDDDLEPQADVVSASTTSPLPTPSTGPEEEV